MPAQIELLAHAVSTLARVVYAVGEALLWPQCLSAAFVSKLGAMTQSKGAGVGDGVGFGVGDAVGASVAQ